MAEARASFLSEAEKQSIHEQTLLILEDVGVAFNTPRAIDLLAEAGAPVDRAQLTARIPGDLIERCLESVPRCVLLAARDPAHDVVLGDGSLSVCSDGTATYLLDDLSGERHPGTADDLRRVMRLLDALPEVDYVWPSISAQDLDPVTANLEIELISLIECAKHVQDEVRGPEYVAPLADILEAIAGAPLRERPIFSAINCTVAPLQHDPAMTEASIELARRGVPIFVMPMPLLGTTAPVSLSGACIVNMAELLSTMVLLQLAAPGCALVAASEPAVADMRTGGYVCGTPSCVLMAVACVEMGRFYGLPTQGPGVGGDGKYPDYQEGLEGALAGALVALAGADSLVGLGTLDGAQSFSLAKAVLDNDAIAMIRRLAARQSADAAASLLDDIKAVGFGGHFLGRRSTREASRSDAVWRPSSLRHGGAAEGTPPGLVLEAADEAREIIAKHVVEPLPDEVARHTAEVVREFAALSAG